MTPKSCKYVDQKTQDNFSCKHENTCKSMEFPTLWKYCWSLTVYLVNDADSVHCLTLNKAQEEFGAMYR